MSSLVEVKNLKKYFATNRGALHAVDDVSFTIEKGKTLGVVGESGCGKSTLGRTIIHLCESTDGQIFYDGKDVTHLNSAGLRELRYNMQIIFQDPYSSLNPRKTVESTIREPIKISKKYSKQETEEQVDELMELVGIDKRMRGAYPHELDGGRRQRVVIARALSVNPSFIVCDEPVSALDVSIQAQIINLLKELQEQYKLTYLFISHDLSVVEHISDMVGVMYLGNLVEYGTTDDIFTNPLHPYTEALFSAIPVPDPTARMNRIVLEGSIPSPANPPAGCKFHTRCSKCMECCKTEVPEQKEIEPGHYVVCHLYD